MKKMIPIVLALIVLVSGCVGSSDFFSAFTGQRGETVEQSPDIIVIENIGTIPMGKINAGTQVTTYFDLRNQGEVGSPALEDVLVKLYNWGECNPVKANFEPNADSWTETSSAYEYTFDELVPNQVERVEMYFDAPTGEEIGFIEADCPISWLVSYNFNARSNDDFTVISNDRLNELQRAGETWDGSDLPQYVGIGPIKTYFAFKTPMPIREENTIQFSVQVEDKGRGTYPEVKAGTLYIKVPTSWGNVGDDAEPCGTKFTELENEGGNRIFRNSKAINLINRATPELICEFEAPSLDIPERSYTVSANVTNYKYVTYGSLDVHVEP